MDETYQTHVNRVARLTVADIYQTQLQNLQKSPKFEAGSAVYFPGYSIITPPWEEENNNENLYQTIKNWQEELEQKLSPGTIAIVPPESFHLTLADLIWEHNYLEAIENNPDFEEKLRAAITDSFDRYKEQKSSSEKIIWQLLGVSLRPRAISVALIPKNENSYDQIAQLRRCIYQNSSLIALGVDQQYHFTAHITLAYFDRISADLDRDFLANILGEMSDRLLEIDPPLLTITKGELRKFENMMHYYREENWPTITF